jgi:hypothetical protein
MISAFQFSQSNMSSYCTPRLTMRLPSCGTARRAPLHPLAKVLRPCQARSVQQHIHWATYRATLSARLLYRALRAALRLAFHAMNSRRSMGLPRAEGHAGHAEEYHNSERIIPQATQWGSRSCPLWVDSVVEVGLMVASATFENTQLFCTSKQHCSLMSFNEQP